VYSLVKPLLFAQDPEAVHDGVMAALAFIARQPALLETVRALCGVTDAALERTVFGLRFPNPVGLAAGLDKNALALPVWEALGFGFTEIGSVTAHAQPGNDKPRMFRLPDDEALINRMGFNNQGAHAIAARLESWKGAKRNTPLGINLGKSKTTPLEDASSDYLESLRLLWTHGDYFVVNVSSPNTPGLRQLQDKEKLEALLEAVTGFAAAQRPTKPILLKIAPDLTWTQVDEILELVRRFNLAGIVATNTTVSRDAVTTPIRETGGLSGAPLRVRSLALLRYLRLHAEVPVISVGGIFHAIDVEQRLEAGAALVQVYTGFIYEGPLMMRNIARVLKARREFAP
jgi:dihydroorotate dehydrogenase